MLIRGHTCIYHPVGSSWIRSLFFPLGDCPARHGTATRVGLESVCVAGVCFGGVRLARFFALPSVPRRGGAGWDVRSCSHFVSVWDLLFLFCVDYLD